MTVPPIHVRSPDEPSKRTPCADYDVRALLGHVIAVLHKITRIGAGVDPRDVPDVIDGINDDGWGAAFAQARREAAELDPDLAARALEAFPKFAPPEERSGHGPFGPAVPVADDADVPSRLAAYLGRRPGP